MKNASHAQGTIQWKSVFMPTAIELDKILRQIIVTILIDIQLIASTKLCKRALATEAIN